MALVKIVQTSDLHSERLKRWNEICKLVKREKADLLLTLGDFFDSSDAVFANELQNRFQRELRKRYQKEWTDINVALGLLKYGGPAQARGLKDNPEFPKEEQDQIGKLLGYYDANQARVHEAIKKYSADSWAKEQQEKIAKRVSKRMGEQYSGLERLLSAQLPKTPILGVAGNWETDVVYEKLGKKITFVEKSDKPVTVAGFTFAGAPNFNERLSVFPKQMYDGIEQDCFSPQEVLAFIDKHGTPEDREEYEAQLENENVLAIPDTVLEKMPTYKRLKDKTVDFLLCHKGTGKLAVSPTQEDFGSGYALERALDTLTRRYELCGHIHGKGFRVEEPDHFGLRSTDQRFYIIHADNVDKKIKKIEVYGWADREKKAAQEAKKAA